MASFIYNSLPLDLASGAIDFQAGVFRALLVGAGYTPDKSGHSRRSQVTDEVSGTGYTAEGVTIPCSAAAGSLANTTVITLGEAEWQSATIAATAAVIYRSRGALAADDELVAYVDFGGLVSSTNATFTVTESTITFSNP
jgi:hypothetical protein